ncbi:MAG: glycosyltransferase family 4 protein [Spirochaetales bacterium]|nr:glycosyltransferase family 4 protein [Spirochaetales bacterium]
MKILIITPHFPTFDVYHSRADDPRTKFLYDYALEWIKIGHDVNIIHCIPRYPSLFSIVVRIIEYFSKNRTGQLERFLQKKDTVQKADYTYKGLKIVRVPISKYIPHRDFFSLSVRILKNRINKLLKQKNWNYDIIISDFLSPSLSIACDLSSFKVPIYQIFHQSDLLYLKNKNLFALLQQIDCALFRSFSLKNEIIKSGYMPKDFHLMFSGIPVDLKLGKCRKSITKFIYVGNLRYSKNVQQLIKAFASAHLNTSCTLEIVGSGPNEREFRLLVDELEISSKVKFMGKLSREQVFKRMAASDCLVMVSKETFGMVYVEAMSQGCIVVAAKAQGIDGVIVDGKNGFLEPLEDIDSLSKTLSKLSCLDEKSIKKISENALHTASRMYDNILAEDLIKKIKITKGVVSGG